MSPELEALAQQWIEKNLHKKPSKLSLFKDLLSMIGSLLALPAAVIAVVGLLNQTEKVAVAQADATAARVSEQQTEALKQVDDELAQVTKLAESETPPEIESPPKDTDALEPIRRKAVEVVKR